MDTETLADWLQSEATNEFFKQVKDSLQLLQSEPRFRLHEQLGDSIVPMNSDMCALKNAYNEGRIESLRELLDSREALIQFHNEVSNDDD
jgi:hypothetical protein